jgi:hypothetical protein
MSNSTYPTSIDSFYDPNSTTDTMASVPHHTQHGQANDAAVALETKLGTGSSTPTTGSFLTGTGTGVSTWVSTLTSPKITTGLNDSNNNTWIGETPTSSAVNYANITNAATGNAPSYGVAGTDTNIDNNITTQGSGKVRDNGSALVDFRSSFANFIQSGGVWSQISGLAGGMTAARIWINGVEYSVSAVSTHTFGASVDTYIDYTVGTGLVYTAVSNNAASPALAANSVRLAIVVSGSSSISSINQGSPAVTAPVASSVVYTVCDSLGNLIYPTAPSPIQIGYRYITTAFTAVTSTTGSQVTGLSLTILAPGNRRIKLEAWCRGLYSTTGTAQNQLQIWSGVVGSGTLLAAAYSTPPAINEPENAKTTAYAMPAAGSATYNVGIATSNASDAVNLDAATIAPAFISAELV